MKIEEVHLLLSAALKTTRIPVPPGTALHSVAQDQLEMARAYESDGTTFFGSGDPVNALAAFFMSSAGSTSGVRMARSLPICRFLPARSSAPAGGSPGT